MIGVILFTCRRSREDLFEDVKEDAATKEVEKTMDDSEMLEEDEEDVTFDEADGALYVGNLQHFPCTLSNTLDPLLLCISVAL